MMVEQDLAGKKSEVEKRVAELMDFTVGPASRLHRVSTLNAGRRIARQRIGIARACRSNPKFIVCDEPVSALDVSHPGADTETLLMGFGRSREALHICSSPITQCLW
ncbi:MAG: hypothetical protein ACLTBV_25280 [Enterocloster bolteae]